MDLHAFLKLSRLRRWLARLVGFVAAPLLVLGAVELVLRLAGYGHPTAFLVRDGDRWTGNAQFGWRFFPRSLSRSPAKFSVPVAKPPGAYRVVVLGESAAMGTPDPAFGLGRMIGAMLRAQMPGRKVEVVNAAMTAINSHAILPIARDCAELKPDLVVIYMGNNEVVGPFGPGTVFAGYSPSRPLLRASLWAKSTRLGQLIENAIARAPDGGRAATWRGMEMFLEQRVAHSDPRLARVYENFRANLYAICAASVDAGAKVIVSTVAVNLDDSPPFASMHRPDLSAADLKNWEDHFNAGKDLQDRGDQGGALAAYADAAKIDGDFAEVHFRMAMCGAPDGFAKARDLDALRFRTDSRINEIIRATRGVTIADSERAFAGAGVASDALFYEHVHLTPAGNYLVAKTVVEQLGHPVIDRRTCFDSIGLTAWDEFRMAGEMTQFTARPPFTGQLGHDQRQRRQFAGLEEFRAKSLDAALQSGRSIYEATLKRDPDDWTLHDKFAALLFERRDYAAAIEHWQRVMERFPGDADTLVRTGNSLLRLGKPADASALFREALAKRGDMPEARKGLGDVLLIGKEFPQAIAEFEAAMRARPDYPEAANNLGAARLATNDLEGATAAFARAVEMRPDSSAHLNLASVYVRRRKFDDAIIHYRAALALNPADSSAHSNLGLMLASTGRLEEAAAEVREALRIDDTNGRAHAVLAGILAKQGRAAEAALHDQRAKELLARPKK